MIFEIEIGGRTRTVSVERTDVPERLRVSVDGRAQVVDVVRTGEFGLSILVPAGTPPASGSRRPEKETVSSGTGRIAADVQITPGTVSGEVLVTVEGRLVAATVNGRRARHAADPGAHGAGDISIVAPMPGRVVRVLSAPGDEVAARQAIVVVEAMKMENELRAPRAGRVKEVSVAPGTSVEAGRILAVIE